LQLAVMLNNVAAVLPPLSLLSIGGARQNTRVGSSRNPEWEGVGTRIWMD
jgi:hypothetical protein